jgi:dTDP-glucose 4,6-dehydratase
MLFVTGGAGFIGSSFVLEVLARTDERVVNVDKLTYAASADNVQSIPEAGRHTLIVADICDAGLMRELLMRHKPRAVVHFAAETHVDRSIAGPGVFVQTNVVGTQILLDSACAYYASLSGDLRAGFRFLHVSTDEVYGSLGFGDSPFTESSPYAPNSPYAASKAASDHLVRAYHRTYGLPTLTTNCSNNYGPRQYPEKLIPFTIRQALAGQPLTVYGDGRNVRDWLHVEDHCRALRAVLDQGRPGRTYNIGGGAERDNLSLVRQVCRLLDRMKPRSAGRYEELITFVPDRPGHDLRYAMDTTRIRAEIGWSPSIGFEDGLERTVAWYLQASGRTAARAG